MSKYQTAAKIYCISITFILLIVGLCAIFQPNQEIKEGLRCLTCEQLDTNTMKLPSNFTELEDHKPVQFNLYFTFFGRGLVENGDTMELTSLQNQIRLANSVHPLVKFQNIGFDTLDYSVAVADIENYDFLRSEIKKNFKENSANIFVVDRLDSYIGGFVRTVFNSDSTLIVDPMHQTIVMTFEAFTNEENTTLIHEIGHLFGLPHLGILFGDENAPLKNCENYNLLYWCYLTPEQQDRFLFYATVKHSEIALPISGISIDGCE